MDTLLLITMLLVILTGTTTGETLGQEISALRKTIWDFKETIMSAKDEQRHIIDKLTFCERMNELEKTKGYCGCPATISTSPRNNCNEWFYRGDTTDGVYPIIVNDRTIQVSCEMEHGGWIVIQKRTSNLLDYNRTMQDYAEGFGDVAGDHWLGLNTVHQLTKTGKWTLRIDLESFWKETAWAEYTDFQVTASPDYRLLFNKASYRGNAGKASYRNHAETPEGRDLSYNHGMKFTTSDVDQDQWTDGNCAYNGNGGWWYNGDVHCTDVLTTGMPDRDYRPVMWYPWKHYNILKTVTLRIKKTEQPYDCKEWFDRGRRSNGPSRILVNGYGNLQVYCNMEQGGWIVIFKRSDRGFVHYHTNNTYVRGFGDVTGEHWLGLNPVHRLTETTSLTLRIDLVTVNSETAWVEYTDFQVTASPDYKLLFNKASYRSNAVGGAELFNLAHGMELFDIIYEVWNHGSEPMKWFPWKHDTVLSSLTFRIKKTEPNQPHDCQEWLDRGYISYDATYPIIVNDRTVRVSCVMEQGGWIVIQKRNDIVLDYNRTMMEYAQGFGNVNGDHWLGLNTVHQLTEFGNWKLRIDLESFNNENAWIEYTDFQVTASPDYKLLFNKTSYSGTAGDDGQGLSYHHGMKFSTFDVDQDGRSGGNCATDTDTIVYRGYRGYGGGGWWYDGNNAACARVSTTGMPSDNPHSIRWYPLESLKSVTLRIKKRE